MLKKKIILKKKQLKEVNLKNLSLLFMELARAAVRQLILNY